ncbi:L-sorbose 1-dehydrogenase-like [Physella acuta]|uniref:L-sorbose 1-dehydrogenase-like n=1 Tax=Physella acuta TaxID=109671 RepID=UPI0027DD8963|nr:L-sorbose 1-dehydrogenase-like [Physella acuta]XP_059174134.1 L-sorbose 1-dehydrogenase-like [Physella acuta]XP_059174135.1 L-sorbose 1-dehydrogenase-like [Physella acuta]XP_059174136.1 L-sorbose 1-dehydrogenase-like [Physella acuta]
MGFWNIIINVLLAALSFYLYQSYVYRRPTYKHIDKLLDSYDYIIVGAGTAGCVLAARLSENSSRTVLLLEAGPSDVSHAEVDTPARVPETFLSRFDWKLYSRPQGQAALGLEGQRIYIPRGKILGGSSQINYMQWSRGHRLDFDRWAEQGSEGWSYRDVLPFFMRSEDVVPKHLANKEYRGSNGKVKITQLNGYGLATVLINAVKSLGFQETDYNAETQEGVAHTQSNIYKGERWSSARAYLWPAADRENLHIVTDTLVHKVLIEHKTAVGVRLIRNSSPVDVRCSKEVILAAGSFGSPQVLMLSGVGPREHLESLKIPVVADLPVGENLHDHVTTALHVITNSSLGLPRTTLYHQLEYLTFGTGPLSSPGGADGLAHLKTLPHLQQPDIQFTLVEQLNDKKFMKVLPGLSAELFHSWKLQEQGRGLMVLVCLLRPKSRGSVRLRSSDPLDSPVIDPNFFSDPQDLDDLVRGVRLALKIVDTEPLRQLGAVIDPAPLPSCVSHLYNSDSYWNCFNRHLASTAHHPAGTCKMGATDDVTTVVDNRLRVKGVRNLRVADASIMPDVVSANTNAATFMIGEKAADMILNDGK